MDAGPTASIPITRPHLPPMDAVLRGRRRPVRQPPVVQLRQVHGIARVASSAAVLDHPAPLCVSSCDIGLTLAWRALECSAGEVIVPSFTFCSTVNALMWNGLEPVFADVDPRTYCIDVEDARRPDHASHRRHRGRTYLRPARGHRAARNPGPRARSQAGLRRRPWARWALSGIRPWAPSATPPSSA